MVANHEIRIKLKPGCHCRTPFSGKACRDRRSSAKTGGGSRGPQICGGRAIRLGGPRRHLLVGRRPATQLANRRNQSGAQYSNLSESLRHHEVHLLTEDLPWSVPSMTSSTGLKIGCGGSPLCTEICSPYVDGRQPEGQIFLRWMRVAAPAGSSLGSLKRIPRESYSALMSTQPLAFAQPTKALARSVPDRSTGCRSQMVLFRRLSALTSCATVA